MKRGSRSRRSRGGQSGMLNDIPLTPLIDTALTLLIIFMVTAPMIQNAVKVELPKGAAKEDAGVQQELVIYLDKEQHLFFNGKEVRLEEVMTELQKTVQGDDGKTVFIRADQAVPYGRVIELVDQIKVVGGVKYVALATQKRA